LLKICRNSVLFALNSCECVTVDRGMKTSIHASIQKGDEFTDNFKNEKSVTIHVQCCKQYPQKRTIAAAIRQHVKEPVSTSQKSPPRTRARVSESYFF